MQVVRMYMLSKAMGLGKTNKYLRADAVANFVSKDSLFEDHAYEIMGDLV